MFTRDELKLLRSRMKHDINRLKETPLGSDNFNTLISSAIKRREKIKFKLDQKLEDLPYANG